MNINQNITKNKSVKVQIIIENTLKNDPIYKYFAQVLLEHKALEIFREKLALTYICNVNVSTDFCIYFTLNNLEKNVLLLKDYFQNNLITDLKFVQSDLQIFKNKVFSDVLIAFESQNQAYFKFWNELLDQDFLTLKYQEVIKIFETEIFWEEDFEEFLHQNIIIKKINIQ